MKLYSLLAFLAVTVQTWKLEIGQQSFIHDDSQAKIDGNPEDVIAASPLLTLHKGLCQIPSVTGNELEVGDFLINFLEAHNFTITKQSVPLEDISKARYNIYATPNLSKYSHKDGHASRKGPKVLLTSHIDTVPPHIPYTLIKPSKSRSRKDLLIHGRGTVDDKACVAAQTIAALSLLSSNTVDPSDIALLFVVGEETLGDGMKHFNSSKLYSSTNSHYKGILFGEPTELKLASGHKGITMLQINATGKAAHSGYPWLGRSANSMILPTLFSLDKLGDLEEEEGGLPRSKKFGKSTVNVGYIRGGVAANVIPEHALAKITFRLAAGPIEKVKGIIMNAVRAADPDNALETKFTQGYDPVQLDHDVDGFESITVNYGTDIPNLDVKEGVKRYLYGPGSILVAHGANEALTVGDLEESVEGYKRLVKHVLTED